MFGVGLVVRMHRAAAGPGEALRARSLGAGLDGGVAVRKDGVAGDAGNVSRCTKALVVVDVASMLQIVDYNDRPGPMRHVVPRKQLH